MKVSKTEDILYDALNKIGLYPKRQYPISDHHVDFAFPEDKLVIEVDGPDHLTEKQKEIDERRRDIAENLGWKVRRFNAKEVYEKTGETADKIKWMLTRNNNNKSLSDFSRKKKVTKIEEKYKSDSDVNLPILKSRSISSEERHRKREMARSLLDSRGWKGKVSLTPQSPIKRKPTLLTILSPESRHNKPPYWLIIVIILLIGFLFFLNYLQSDIITGLVTNENVNISYPSPPAAPIIPDVEVGVEGFNINIKNNLQTPVYVNVTYQQYSQWFGIDNKVTFVELVNPNSVKTITDWAGNTNIATSNAPYSISIINYTYSK